MAEAAASQLSLSFFWPSVRATVFKYTSARNLTLPLTHQDKNTVPLVLGSLQKFASILKEKQGAEVTNLLLS